MTPRIQLKRKMRIGNMKENEMLKQLKEKHEEYLSVLRESCNFLSKKDFVDIDGVLITNISYSALASHLNNVENAGELIMNMEIDEFDDICVNKSKL